MKKLTITAISEVRQDKNGRNFKNIKLQQSATFVDAEGCIVTDMSRTKSTTYNAYEQSYLPGGSQDPLFNATLNSKVVGDIVQVTVPPYEIDEKRGGQLTGHKVTLTKAPVLVFADSDDEQGFQEATDKAQARKIAELERQSISAGSVAGTSI